MKLILENQNSVRVRLTEAEFKQFETEKYFENEFHGLGKLKFLLKVLKYNVEEEGLVRWLPFADTNTYEIHLSQRGIEFLKNPSKKGISVDFLTDQGHLHLGVEVDLKY